MTPLAQALGRPQERETPASGREPTTQRPRPAAPTLVEPTSPGYDHQQEVAGGTPALLDIERDLSDLLARLLASGARLAEAIQVTGIAPELAARLLRENAFKQRVMDYLPSVEDVRARLVAASSRAADAAIGLLDAGNESERGKAARDLLDRVGVQAVRKVAQVTLVVEERKARLLAAALDEAGLKLLPAALPEQNKETH